jgi:hypothetical protein
MADLTVSTIFDLHAAASFDKQLHLADLVSKLSWQFNLSPGLLSFGDRFHWHVWYLP